MPSTAPSPVHMSGHISIATNPAGGLGGGSGHGGSSSRFPPVPCELLTYSVQSLLAALTRYQGKRKGIPPPLPLLGGGACSVLWPSVAAANLALELRLPNHAMPRGRGSSSIAPSSRLDVGSAVFAGKVGKERWTNHTPPRRQESSTAVCRGRFCPCTWVKFSIGKLHESPVFVDEG
ncbi:hypothetical protein EK904_004116 [Melospiza melodia maxima]|nr:hypothetical protein EK904_004116 [Melospiza melodia maxima]